MRNEVRHMGHLVSGHWDGVLPASYSTRNGCGNIKKKEKKKRVPAWMKLPPTQLRHFTGVIVFGGRPGFRSISTMSDAEVAGDRHISLAVFSFFNAYSYFYSIHSKIINRKRKCFSFANNTAVLLQWIFYGEIGVFFQDPEQSGFAETAFQFVFVERLEG